MFQLIHLRFSGKKAFFLLMFLLFLEHDSAYLFSHPDPDAKDKIYVANIIMEQNVPGTIRESFIVKLKSELLDLVGDNYYIVCQSDLDLLFKQVENLQKQGRDTKEILSQIADARDADEMIHGKVFKYQGQIKLLLNNLRRDPKTKDFYTKSIVDISFYESDFDYYMKEVAIKIMNPRYKVKSGESILADNKKGLDTKQNIPNYSDPKLISVGEVEWGKFEGLMKWNEAVGVCKNKGMRLPTPEELRDMAQLKNHILIEPCCVFWSSRSSTKDSDYAYYIDINDGFGNFYHKEIDVRVRCVKN